MSDEYISVARTPDVGPGDVREVEAHGQNFGLTNVGQTYYAFDPSCPEDGTNLARDGVIKGDLLVCPQDEASFDLRTGERMDSQGDGLTLYAIRVEDNEVKIGPPIAD